MLELDYWPIDMYQVEGEQIQWVSFKHLFKIADEHHICGLLILHFPGEQTFI